MSASRSCRAGSLPRGISVGSWAVLIIAATALSITSKSVVAGRFDTFLGCGCQIVVHLRLQLLIEVAEFREQADLARTDNRHGAAPKSQRLGHSRRRR